jgi:hypothetical protein
VIPLAVLALAPMLLAVSPAAAAERTYAEGISSRMTLRVQPDGTIDVTEDVTFRFVGHHTGRERVLDWEADDGVLVDRVQVSEGETAYRDGGTRKPGTGVPGTYAVDLTERYAGADVTWHFDATNETRTFRFSYRMRRQTVAYADTAEIKLGLFSSRDMQAALDRLDVAVVLPGPAGGDGFKVWVSPSHSRWSMELDGNRLAVAMPEIPVSLSGSSRYQYVTLHLLFPRSLLTSTAGARTSSEAAFDRIVREREEGSRTPSPSSPFRFLLPFVIFGLVVNLVTWVVRRVRRRSRPAL